MEPPLLKLVMVQGPREGEKLEFRTGSTIRIGRLARGNNISIKDAGISSKHLFIGSESGKWIVQDLDSSNGTTLNSTKLPPFTPFDLQDGDSIKLGEVTSILVRFVGGDEPSQLRRNPRRKVNELDKKGSVAEAPSQRAEAVIITEENSGLESENVENRRRGRQRKARVLDKVTEIDKESEKLDFVAEKPETRRVNVRVTRNRKNEDCLILENLGGECGKRTRGGRGRRKNLPELPLESSQVRSLENKENIDSGLNLREEAQAQTIEVSVSGDKEIKLEIMEDEKEEGLGAETTYKDSENGVDLKENDGKQQNNTSKNLVKENDGKEQTNASKNLGKENEVLGGETTYRNAENGVDLKENDGKAQTNASKDLGKEDEVLGAETTYKGDENGDDLKENDGKPQTNVSKNLGGEKVALDLEKMTLGQWFDYMEAHLPKQIIEATEELIEGMTRKAERVKEYMVEQKKARAAKEAAR
ncbi:FHA domain-containing protein At4g14490 isoform X2 [Jatropha curcas]|uniref:FHA domain-containing protein At4g14490 isoform X2 n=1 Tax=Jatropha curcas TaxID=180498 RepID=UPI0005FB0ED7|nr:FHA domain-containing protein At4g14490 isoform X2 [Jatropha curcas]